MHSGANEADIALLLFWSFEASGYRTTGEIPRLFQRLNQISHVWEFGDDVDLAGRVAFSVGGHKYAGSVANFFGGQPVEDKKGKQKQMTPAKEQLAIKIEEHQIASTFARDRGY